jgi:hypothetical protein
LRLLERLHGAEADQVVPFLAEAEVATSETAMGECVAKAPELEGNLRGASWDLFEALEQLKGRDDPLGGEAEAVLAQLRKALESDEHVIRLAPALEGAQAKAVRLLARSPRPAPAPVPPDLPEPPKKSGRRVVDRGAKPELSLDEANEFLTRLATGLKSGQVLRLSLSWTVEEAEREP